MTDAEFKKWLEDEVQEFLRQKASIKPLSLESVFTSMNRDFQRDKGKQVEVVKVRNNGKGEK